MAVYLFTSRPQELLAAFDARIAQVEQFGRIDNWKKDDENPSYTHTASDWSGRARMVPRMEADRLTFNISKSGDWPASAVGYAYYHSQLLQAFLRNLDLKFELATLTPRCASGDDYA